MLYLWCVSVWGRSVSVLPNKRQYQNSISRNKCKDDNDIILNAVFVVCGV